MSRHDFKHFPEHTRRRIGGRVYQTNQFILRTAIELQKQYADDYAAYLSDCADWHNEGFRPHYCEHGTNLWTDYDNICGGCEEGATMSDGMQRRERALYEAKRMWSVIDAMTITINTMQRNHVEFDMGAYLSVMAKYMTEFNKWERAIDSQSVKLPR